VNRDFTSTVQRRLYLNRS